MCQWCVAPGPLQGAEAEAVRRCCKARGMGGKVCCELRAEPRCAGLDPGSHPTAVQIGEANSMAGMVSIRDVVHVMLKEHRCVCCSRQGSVACLAAAAPRAGRQTVHEARRCPVPCLACSYTSSFLP